MAKGAPAGIEGDGLICVFLDNYICLNLMQERFFDRNARQQPKFFMIQHDMKLFYADKNLRLAKF